LTSITVGLSFKDPFVVSAVLLQNASKTTPPFANAYKTSRHHAALHVVSLIPNVQMGDITVERNTTRKHAAQQENGRRSAGKSFYVSMCKMFTLQ